MKSHTLFSGLLLSAFMALPGLSFSQNFVWAKAMGGADDDSGNSIAFDASGNLYTAGNFTGTADFDPGAGVFNLTSAGGPAVFVSKFDASGNFVWAKTMGGTAATQIVLDASGNIYTTGYFQGTADFDPGAGLFNLISAGGADIFVSKLDASGNFVWAKAMGGANFDNGNSIALDLNGNVYTTGFFDGTADFDPGVALSNLTSSGSKEVFVSKLDASGNFVWAKAMGGTGPDRGYSIAVDASGNVLITGDFESTVDFDPGAALFNLSSSGINDVFIVKLDASGNFVWAKKMGGTNYDIGRSVKLDASNNVYITGAFTASVDFDPGMAVFNLTSAGGNDIFISKLDASGNFVWAKNMGGPENDISFSMAIDDSGNLYTTGYFRNTADFDPDAGLFSLTSAGVLDVFIAKLNASGSFAWARAMGGTGIDIANAIALDASNHVYSTGAFNGTVDFDPGAGLFNLTSAGNTEIFIHKMSQTMVNVEETRELTSIAVYPNPNEGTFSLTIDKEINKGKLVLINAIGQIVHEQKIVQGTNEIVTHGLPVGLYNWTLFRHNQLAIQGKLIIE